jgi:hypothetical protein
LTRIRLAGICWAKDICRWLRAWMIARVATAAVAEDPQASWVPSSSPSDLSSILDPAHG